MPSATALTLGQPWIGQGAGRDGCCRFLTTENNFILLCSVLKIWEVEYIQIYPKDKVKHWNLICQRQSFTLSFVKKKRWVWHYFLYSKRSHPEKQTLNLSKEENRIQVSQATEQKNLYRTILPHHCVILTCMAYTTSHWKSAIPFVRNRTLANAKQAFQGVARQSLV